MKSPIAGAALGLLLASACGPLSEYASYEVVALGPDSVTIRYSEVALHDPLPEVTALAEAQCAGLGRRALFQWDIELLAEHRPPAGQYVEPGRLRPSTHHHVYFRCVGESERAGR